MKTFPSPTSHGNWQVRNGQLEDVDQVAEGDSDLPRGSETDATVTETPAQEATPDTHEHDQGDKPPEPKPSRRRKAAATTDSDSTR